MTSESELVITITAEDAERAFADGLSGAEFVATMIQKAANEQGMAISDVVVEAGGYVGRPDPRVEVLSEPEDDEPEDDGPCDACGKTIPLDAAFADLRVPPDGFVFEDDDYESFAAYKETGVAAAITCDSACMARLDDSGWRYPTPDELAAVKSFYQEGNE